MSDLKRPTAMPLSSQTCITSRHRLKKMDCWFRDEQFLPPVALCLKAENQETCTEKAAEFLGMPSCRPGGLFFVLSNEALFVMIDFAQKNKRLAETTVFVSGKR